MKIWRSGLQLSMTNGLSLFQIHYTQCSGFMREKIRRAQLEFRCFLRSSANHMSPNQIFIPVIPHPQVNPPLDDSIIKTHTDCSLFMCKWLNIYVRYWRSDSLRSTIRSSVPFGVVGWSIINDMPLHLSWDTSNDRLRIPT